MVPRQHQIEGATWALKTLRLYGLAYLSWEERTGKTLTALLTVENSLAKTCLIVTKKRAIEGWEETLGQWTHDTAFEVINYESASKIMKKYDFIILDESHHAISSTGRPSKTWKTIYRLTKGKPILYLSATPYAEHVGLLYHQLKLSDWSPFKGYKNFYRWFDVYGIPKLIRTAYGLQETYKSYKTEEVLVNVDYLFNFKTRLDVGIEYEPEANLVVVPLSARTKDLIAKWTNEQMITFRVHVAWDEPNPLIEVLGDSDMKMRMVHYQLEGGTLKIDDTKSIFLEDHEKLDYIKANYDLRNTAIMAHFIKERELLERELPECTILSSDGHAEGVDLHKVDKLVVYSMSFKTSKYTQRLARQANHNRDTPIVVDILVGSEPGIGGAVYKAVAIKKMNFVKNSYERAVR